MLDRIRGSFFIEVTVVLTALCVTVALFFGLVPKIVSNYSSADSLRALTNLREPLMVSQLTREGKTITATAPQVVGALREHLAALNKTAPKSNFCAFMIEVDSSNSEDCENNSTIAAFYPVDISSPYFLSAVDISSLGYNLSMPFGIDADGNLCPVAPPESLENMIVRMAHRSPCLKPTPFNLYAVFDANHPEYFDIRGALGSLNLDRCGLIAGNQPMGRPPQNPFDGSWGAPELGSYTEFNPDGDPQAFSMGCCLLSRDFDECCALFPDTTGCEEVISSSSVSSSSSSSQDSSVSSSESSLSSDQSSDVSSESSSTVFRGDSSSDSSESWSSFDPNGTGPIEGEGSSENNSDITTYGTYLN